MLGDLMARLPELLRTASRARRGPWSHTPWGRAPRGPAPDDDTYDPEPRARPGLPLVGCLFRLLLFLVLMMLFGFGSIFMLLGGGFLDFFG